MEFDYPQFTHAHDTGRPERVTPSDVFLSFSNAVQRAHLAGIVVEREDLANGEEKSLLFIKGFSAISIDRPTYDPTNIRIFRENSNTGNLDTHIARVSYRLEGQVVRRDISIVRGKYSITTPIVHHSKVTGKVKAFHRPLLVDEAIDFKARLDNFKPITEDDTHEPTA